MTFLSARLRAWVGLLLLVLGLALCFGGYSSEPSDPDGALMLNLGTELFGIVLTVVFVERLFEERKNREDARRLALRFLHDIDYAVWVWQGGRRQFSSIELQDLLNHVQHTDPVALCTALLLMSIGESAAKSRRYEEEAVRCSPQLSRGLRVLETFVQMRDPGYTVSAAEIGSRLSKAASDLCLAADVRRSDSVFPLLPEMRNSSVEQQKRRYAGGYLEVRAERKLLNVRG